MDESDDMTELAIESEAAEMAEVLTEESEEPVGGELTTERPVGTSRDEIADFIFELENVTDIPEAARKDADPAASDGTGPTCDECVYDETCPNRDQRSPRECGSFQWKIA
jgi:hypothetical protein